MANNDRATAFCIKSTRSPFRPELYKSLRPLRAEHLSEGLCWRVLKTTCRERGAQRGVLLLNQHPAAPGEHPDEKAVQSRHCHCTHLHFFALFPCVPTPRAARRATTAPYRYQGSTTPAQFRLAARLQSGGTRRDGREQLNPLAKSTREPPAPDRRSLAPRLLPALTAYRSYPTRSVPTPRQNPG